MTTLDSADPSDDQPLIIALRSLGRSIVEFKLFRDKVQCASQELAVEMNDDLPPMKIFVSYSHADRDVVYSIVAKLRECGMNILVDFDQISPGDEWREVLRETIENADGVIIIVSHSYLDSEFCKIEFKTARYFHKFLCTPILVDDCWDRVLADDAFSEACANVPIDFYRGEFAGLQASRDKLLAKLVEGLTAARSDLWDVVSEADVVVAALSRDEEFAHSLVSAIEAEGLTAYTISDRGYAGQDIEQLMYYFMKRAKFCVIVVSEDCLSISSITGGFALASEEHRLPVLAIVTPELSARTAALNEEIRKIQKMDRVFARVLDRQVVLSNRPLSQVAVDVRTAMLRARRSLHQSPIRLGMFERILDLLKRLRKT